MTTSTTNSTSKADLVAQGQQNALDEWAVTSAPPNTPLLGSALLERS